MTQAPVAGHFVQVQPGVRLHYACCGDPSRPLLLLLHGFPEYWGAWQELMPEFADAFYVVAPDLRGYNLSDKPDGVKAYRAPALVADVVGLIEALGRRSATVVAHDWGGAVAWALAIAHPQRVDRLVILNAPHPVPFARLLANDPAQQAASSYMNWLRRPDSAQRLAADHCARLFTMLQAGEGGTWLDGPTRERYLQAWQQPGALEAAVNWYKASPLYPPQGDDPGAARVDLKPADFMVRVPTLVLWGERDQALLPSLLDGLDALVPELRIVRLPQASHWLVHEAPAAVAREIRTFIEHHGA